MRRAHRETRRPTRGGPRGGVCGNRKVLFQGHSEHPRTGETLQPVPPESQASQSSPRESNESLEKLSKASRDRSAPALRTGVLVRGVGAHPTKKGGLAPPSLLDPPLTGFSDTNGKAHSQTEHRRHTREWGAPPPAQKQAPRRQTWNAPGAPRRLQETARAHTRREGYATPPATSTDSGNMVKRDTTKVKHVRAQPGASHIHKDHANH